MPNWVKNIVHIEGPAEEIAEAIEFMRDKNPEHSNDIDFNNVIPMPERLRIVSGGYDREYVALYLKTVSKEDRQNLRTMLVTYPVSYYGNYLKKYAESFTMDISDDNLNRMRSLGLKEYAVVAPTSMEDVGKAYIDNILEYGHDTWYEWCTYNWGTKWNACRGVIGDNYLEFETAWSAPAPIITELSQRFPELIFHHEWANECLGFGCGKHEVKNGLVISEYHFESDEEAHEFACMLWGYDPDEFEEE